MKHQEIFDKVADHLLTQGERSFSDGVCSYRGDGGFKCAIGALIPDNKYDPEMEGKGVNSLMVSGILLDMGIWSLANEEYDLRFLTDLQKIHDRGDPTDWRFELGKLANAYSLNPARTFRYLETDKV